MFHNKSNFAYKSRLSSYLYFSWPLRIFIFRKRSMKSLIGIEYRSRCSTKQMMHSFMKSSPMRLRSTVFTIFIAEKHLSTDAVATGSTNTNLRSQYTKGKARYLFVLAINLASSEIVLSPTNLSSAHTLSM